MKGKIKPLKMQPKKPAISVFGRNLPEKIESLPREVLKWIQSLDLTYSVKNVKKDFNNGFLVAQILSRYYPVTNDQMSNYKAIQMHMIDNGFSMERRRDNWNTIKKFLSKITEITTKIEDVDTLVKNENGEILLFIISLYQELTKRNVPILDGKQIITDIDNINKSYLLKENGEIEQLKKTDLDNLNANATNVMNNLNGVEQKAPSTGDKPVEEFQKTQKTSNSILSKTGNVVMKGDVKPMAAQPTQMEKGFKVKISEPKIFEQPTRTVYQAREPDSIARVSGVPKSEVDNLVFNSLFQNDRDIETKSNSNDNPFLSLGEPLSNKIQNDFPNDFSKIRFSKGGKFLNDFFRSIDELSEAVISLVLQYLIKIIEDFYNILSGKQVNDYIDTFLILFNAYINLESFDDENKKFTILHEGLIQFLNKSLKNKNEEMFFIFKQIFIEKIFETINDREYSAKLYYLCDLLFNILEPNDDQQVELFKMFKTKIPNEEILYECFSILHDKIPNYTDSLLDGCLFYILNGIMSDNPKIRYFSLSMLLKYSMINVNFVSNFANKLKRLSKRERDRENCLLIIKIVAQTLRAAYLKKTAPKDNKKNTTTMTLEKSENDPDSQNYLNDLTFANTIINDIVSRYTGDHIFILLFTSAIYEYLYDNAELYKILLNALFSVNDSIHRFMFYDEDLDENMNLKYQCTIFRNPVNIEKIKSWNKPMLMKAFDMLILEKGKTDLDDRDYDMIKFLTKDGLDVASSEIWKTSFNISGLVIKDMDKLSRVYTSLDILDAFLLCEPIQKYIFDEWYDNLNKVFVEIIEGSAANEDLKKCEDGIKECLQRWIGNAKISQIVRDDIRKLMEVFPKEQKEEIQSM